MSSFDRLVIGMTQAERMELYEKLTAAVNPEEQTVEEAPLPKEFLNETDVKTQIKGEPPLFRFMLFVRSIFSGLDMQRVYNNLSLQRLAKYVEKKESSLLNYKKGTLKVGFYDRIKSLRAAAEFFMPGIDLYEDDPGRFYVFLSSLILPEIYMHIEEETDPFLLSDGTEPSPDLRALQLRRLEESLAAITGSERTKLYMAVTTLDWLRQFVRLPFDRLLSRFVVLGTGDYMCQLDAVSGELAQFSRVLCNGKTVSTDVLQALFLFSIQTQLADPNLDVVKMSTEYVTKSIAQIGVIKRFLQQVPLRSITALAFNTVSWQPRQPEGVEDWLIKYKGAWRKLFDKQWANWVKSIEMRQIEQKIAGILSTDEKPRLPHRPWSLMWTEMKFTRDSAMGFLWTFFQKRYPQAEKLIKVLVVDGDFKIRENRVELCEAFNDLNAVCEETASFADKLAPNGIVGQIFTNALEKDDRTIKAYARLDSALMSVTSEAGMLITRFSQAVKRIANVLGGVCAPSEAEVGASGEPKKEGYDTINNIAAIMGKQNSVYRRQLLQVRDVLSDADECVKQLEILDA